MPKKQAGSTHEKNREIPLSHSAHPAENGDQKMPDTQISISRHLLVILSTWTIQESQLAVFDPLDRLPTVSLPYLSL